MIILLLITYVFGSSDMVSLPVVGLVVATLGLLWFWRKLKKQKRLNGLKEIPGPTGFPIIGSVLKLANFPHLQFSKWSKEYGDVCQVKLGFITNIVISDPKLAKEIFSNDAAFTGKPVLPEFTIYQERGLGLFNTEGEMWETHRRFLLRQLRDFGFGKSAMETLIMDETNEIIQRFKSKEGKPISGIRPTLRLAVVNSLWRILTSQRFSQDDPELLKLTSNTSDSIDEVFQRGAILLFLPWLRHLAPELSGYNAIRRVMDENKALFEKTVKQHRDEFQEDNLRDFIDVYLDEVRKTTDQNSPFRESVADRQLVASLFDLFLAGSDTTATTIAWVILYLCKFPHVQKKLQEEIEEVTGNSRQVSVDDRQMMPYALATIDEVLRFSSIVPTGVQHCALADRDFHGYFIPKGSWIQPNIHFMNNNPKIWGDPQNFRPERFISADGKKYQKNDNLQAFQIGRRQCVGETLARDTVFLNMANVFQRFSITFDPDSPEPTVEPVAGFLLCPQPYSVIMKDRLSK